jgi:hypothetical protein
VVAADLLECSICNTAFSSDAKSDLLPHVLWRCGHSICVGDLNKLLKNGKVM